MRRALLAFALASAALPARPQSLDERRQALAALNVQEDALAARIGANRNALARLLGALELFSRDPPPPLLVSPHDAKDAVRAMILSRAITEALEARAHALDAQALALARLRRQAAEASGDLFTAESELEDRQGRLDAVAGDADLFAPAGARAEVSAEDGQPAPTSLIAPTPGPIAVRFGGRLQSGLRADGLAWRTEAGAQVLSPAAAVVAYAGPLNGWGEVVILRAGGGCHMVLSGLGKVTVTQGQSVTAAFPLGSMPTDGHTQPELYFEVRMAGGPIDPARLMSADRGAFFNASGLRLRREGAD
jgi:septal ring factor EnvC (AmiA/AmiB activator)